MIQTRIQEADGNDVTEIVGAGADEATQHLFDDFRKAHATACETPNVNHFRSCVEAYDRWLAHFLTEVQL